MDIYKKRNYWKRLLLLIGVLIVIFSVNYIRGLAKEIASQEQLRAEEIAQAYLTLNVTEDSDELMERRMAYGNFRGCRTCVHH